MSEDNQAHYYIPAPTYWPLIGSIALFCLFFGAANWLHQKVYGPYLFLFGAFLFAFMLYGWFSTVIKEDRSGLLSGKKINRSFRLGMIWFIFTEIMFFGTCFGVLFYTRNFSVPWLAGHGSGAMTHMLLWPNFHGTWPVYQTPDPSKYAGPKAIMEAWGVPAVNTIILLSSGATITIAHWALLKSKRAFMLIAQLATILLGIIFIGLQAYEYGLAYTVKGLKLSSGIFGSTFFMLTGFHAMHVLLGIAMLITMFYRMYRADFTETNHFAFQATTWYWHFVDVVWLALFVFVYWI